MVETYYVPDFLDDSDALLTECGGHSSDPPAHTVSATTPHPPQGEGETEDSAKY